MSAQFTIENEILELINQRRAQINLSPLVMHNTVVEQALHHANNIASGNVPFGHQGFTERINSLHQQYTLTAASENLALGQNSAKEVFDAWMNSSKNKMNIEGAFNLTGIATAKNNKGEKIFTQIFLKTYQNTLPASEDSEFYVVSSKASNSLNHKILLRINEYRIQKNMMPLTQQPIVETVAVLHAQNMASDKIPLGHAGFSERASEIVQSIKATKVGENVAVGPSDADAIVQSWIQSPEHHKNILGDFTYTGIGTAQNDSEQIFYCQIFVQ